MNSLFDDKIEPAVEAIQSVNNELKKEVIDTVGTTMKDIRCLLCGAMDWKVPKGVFELHSPETKHNLFKDLALGEGFGDFLRGITSKCKDAGVSIDLGHLEVLPVTCKKCGNIHFLNIILLAENHIAAKPTYYATKLADLVSEKMPEGSTKEEKEAELKRIVDTLTMMDEIEKEEQGK